MGRRTHFPGSGCQLRGGVWGPSCWQKSCKFADVGLSAPLSASLGLQVPGSAGAQGAGMAPRAWEMGNAAVTYRGGESRRHLPNLFGLSICVREERSEFLRG